MLIWTLRVMAAADKDTSGSGNAAAELLVRQWQLQGQH
jgi:hypothetical protein